MRYLLILALVPTLALGQESDAGVETPDAGRWSAAQYSDCPVTDELAVRTDAGTWVMPDIRFRRVACLMESCRTHDELSTRRLLTEPMSLLPGWFVPTLAALIGLGLGIVLGYAISRATK